MFHFLASALTTRFLGDDEEQYGAHSRPPERVTVHWPVVRQPTGPLFVFEKNYYGRRQRIGEQTSNGSFYPFRWQDLSENIEHYPAPASVPVDRIALAASRTDGRLYIKRQVGNAAADPFSSWLLVDLGMVS